MDNPIEDFDLDTEFWRPLTAREQTNSRGLRTRAWAMLRQQSPGLVDRLDAGTVPVHTVEQVLLQAVFRVLNNPAGRQQQSAAQDDYSESWTVPNAVALGALFFTDDELAQLNPNAPAASQRGKAFSIDTTPAAARYGCW